MSSDNDSFGIESQGDANTPGGANGAFKESPVKKSAFGFIKKPSTANKIEGNEPEQQNAFNILPVSTGGENNNSFNANDLLSLDFKTTSLSNLANEANTTKSQPSGGFPMAFKTKV